MPTGISRARTHRRSRTISGQERAVAKAIPISITSATWDDTELTLVFNQPVSLKGIPQYPAMAGNLPTAAELTAPNTLVLTYGDAGKGAPTVTIPSEEPAVRNSSGGFVTPTTFPV